MQKLVVLLQFAQILSWREFLCIGTSEKIKDFFLKKFKPKVYLALSSRSSDIQMLLSQPFSLKKLIGFIAVLSKR